MSRSCISRPRIKIAVGIAGYQEVVGTNRAIGSCYKSVDHVFFIDGIYSKYYRYSNTKNKLSDDGTRELAARYPNVILQDMPMSTEIGKRNKLLSLCKQYSCDFLITLDTDEYIIEADWALFRKNLKEIVLERDRGKYLVYNIPFTENWGLPGGWTAQRQRLFYRPSKIRYYGKHYRYKILDKQSVEYGRIYDGDSGFDTIRGIRIKEDKSVRSAEREKAMKEYENTYLIPRNGYETTYSIVRMGYKVRP